MKKRTFTASAISLLVASLPAFGNTNGHLIDPSLPTQSLTQSASYSSEWSYDTVRSIVLALISEYSTFPEEEIILDGSLADMGFDSYDVFSLCLDCNDIFDINLNTDYIIATGMYLSINQFIDLVYYEYTK